MVAIRSGLVVGLLAALCGCGGTSTPPAVTQSPFDLKAAQFASLNNTTAGLLGPTPAELPQSGTAQYTGSASYSTDPAADPVSNALLRSDVTLVYDFTRPADNAITGSFDNFYGKDPADGTVAPLSGSLAVTSLAANGDGFQGPLIDGAYLATADGVLFDGTENAAVNLRMNGGFLGSNVAYTDGRLSGTVTTTGGVFPLYGYYLGQK